MPQADVEGTEIGELINRILALAPKAGLHIGITVKVAKPSPRLTTPTCEMGFWKADVRGCPVCGPDGPCQREERDDATR